MAEKSTLMLSGVPEADCANFNPTRLALARKRRGFTKTELAKKIGLSLRALTSYEVGDYPPSPEVLSKMESILGFPAAFYEGNDIDEPQVISVSFRSLSRMTARLRDMALSQGALAIHFSQWLERLFELPASDIPDLSAESDPEVAAEFLRQAWGVGQIPIKNMIHLLESKGVRVFSIAVDSQDVDAFSTWKNNTPFIFLNSYKSAERSRFDAAHELGHLVMHKHGGPTGRDAEVEANKFASAFLMPKGGVLAAGLSKLASLSEIRRLKRIWITSMVAMCHRLRELNLISDWNYKGLFIEMSKRGYRVNEPDPAPRETSLILPKILGNLYQQDKMTRARIAQELTLPVSELEGMLFSLVMTGVSGGNMRGNPPGNPALLSRVK